SLSVGAGQITAKFLETKLLVQNCGAGVFELMGPLLPENEESDGKLERTGLSLSNNPAKSDHDKNYPCGAEEVTIGNKTDSGLFREAEIDNGSSRLIKADCGLGSIVIQFE